MEAVREAFGLDDKLRHKTAEAANARQRRGLSPTVEEDGDNLATAEPHGGHDGKEIQGEVAQDRHHNANHGPGPDAEEQHDDMLENDDIQDNGDGNLDGEDMAWGLGRRSRPGQINSGGVRTYARRIKCTTVRGCYSYMLTGCDSNA